MKTKYLKIVVCAVALCFLTTPLIADLTLPFNETWNQQTPGDNANQLTWWSYEPAYGNAAAADTTVVTVSGPDNALNMNPQNSESTGIRSQRAFFSSGTLSVQSDIQLTTDGSGAGVIGFCQNNSPLNGYVLAVSRDPGGGAWLDLRKFFGSLDDSFTTGPVYFQSLDPLTRHTYRIDAALTPGQITFSVYVDGQHKTHTYLDVTDPAPHSFTTGLNFVLASNFGQQTYFDNFQAIPEPASLILLTLSTLALLKKKRK